MRAQAALGLVQDRIRYVALAMGTGGLVPADAATTWSRRFGDCKGKTVLLLAMLRALGVTTEQRTRVLPQLPTLAEQGLAGFDAYSWQGLTVPTATAADDVKRFNAALVAALQSEAVQAKLLAMGVEPTPGTAQQMASYVATERERWGKLIRERGIKVD